jgi:CubicO group peptidase (beta-lactamase class C family)
MKPYVWARIFREDLIGAPGEKVLYSDLGFIMLHNILELETGEPLQDFYRKNITDPLHITDEMMFKPDPEKYDIVQTSENDPPGVVNDLNARAMGGISGHAGLFGTARGVARIGMEILNAIRNRPSLFDHFTASEFAEEVKVRGRTMRPMGFDSARGANPSCGKYFSGQSIGHTGFTGTSVWIDPDNELIVALLTNRVLLGETNTLIKEFRPAIHEAIFRSIQAPLHQAEGY